MKLIEKIKRDAVVNGAVNWPELERIIATDEAERAALAQFLAEQAIGICSTLSACATNLITHAAQVSAQSHTAGSES